MSKKQKEIAVGYARYAEDQENIRHDVAARIKGP